MSQLSPKQPQSVSSPSSQRGAKLVFALLLFALTLSSCGTHTNTVGESLLDDYKKATTFARARDVNTRKMSVQLDELDARAQAVRKEIPEEFYFRYRRLIDATRNIMTEKQDDSTRQRTIDYVKEITGAVPADGDLIPAAADAITVELSRLRVLLHE